MLIYVKTSMLNDFHYSQLLTAVSMWWQQNPWYKHKKHSFLSPKISHRKLALFIMFTFTRSKLWKNTSFLWRRPRPRMCYCRLRFWSKSLHSLYLHHNNNNFMITINCPNILVLCRCTRGSIQSTATQGWEFRNLVTASSQFIVPITSSWLASSSRSLL